MLPLRIVVRTQTAWETMTRESYLAQRNDPANWAPEDFIRKGANPIPLWEQATGKSFYQYRAALKKVCQAELQKTGLPITIGLGNIDWDGPDEALIFVDDDDVIQPSVASIADRFTDDINIVVWNRITNYLGRMRQENPYYGGMLDTCNWAIRKSFMGRLYPSERDSAAARHWIAANFFAKLIFGPKKPLSLIEQAKAKLTSRGGSIDLVHPSVLVLDECHSVYYLHSASVSFLAFKMKPEKAEVVEYLSKLPLHPLYNASC
jgi:hypothetical protein